MPKSTGDVGYRLHPHRRGDRGGAGRVLAAVRPPPGRTGGGYAVAPAVEEGHKEDAAGARGAPGVRRGVPVARRGDADREAAGGTRPRAGARRPRPRAAAGGARPALWILALPLEVPRVHPEEYLRSLLAEVQEQVRKRLQGAAHGGPRHLFGTRRAREARPASDEDAARILRRGASWHGDGALGAWEYTAAA